MIIDPKSPPMTLVSVLKTASPETGLNNISTDYLYHTTHIPIPCQHLCHTVMLQVPGTLTLLFSRLFSCFSKRVGRIPPPFTSFPSLLQILNYDVWGEQTPKCPSLFLFWMILMKNGFLMN